MVASVSWLVRPAALVVSCLVVVAAGWGQTQTQTQTTPAPARKDARSKKHVDPEINAQFQKGDVKSFIKRFESNDREVYAKRREIAKVLDLKPGMAVADIGAGSGLFTRLFAEKVGDKGKVYAVDVSKVFLDHIASQAKASGRTQIVTVRGTQDSTNLPPNSIDVAFLCDVYHHLENYEKILESIHKALKVQGVLVLVEFDRVEGKSSDFVLKHIRAGQAEFRHEIESAGFEPVKDFDAPKLKENFVAKFRKGERDSKNEKKAGKPARRLRRPARATE